ncbi:MAG: acyl-CoA dehydrogenase [Polyangia bacterium]|jgi:alkylation response protein AidB-like acyl-CoA dehydrogenase
MTTRGLLDPALADAVGGWLSAPHAHHDETRPALRWLHGPAGPLAAGQSHDRIEIARILASVASVDMSVAFSLWCHRMAIVYLRAADHDAAARRWLPLLEPAEIAGSTALAAAMAHHVAGEPLSITGRPLQGELVLDGRIRWASNLFGTQFLLVTAVDVAGQGPRIVALSGDQPGLTVDEHPQLLDLQATLSSSLRLTAVRVQPEAVLTADFHGFIRAVRPTFLLWQASFAWGLAARALDAASPHVGRGPSRVFAPEAVELASERDRIEADILSALRASDPALSRGGGGAAPGELAGVVSLRLAAARLAGSATRLECKVTGGAGYASGSPTARRLREAAFLPIQSPTEGQLQWELLRSR